MDHDGCKGCVYKSESATGKHCLYGTKQGDMYKKATNADRIRAMTDEELAEFLYDTDHYDYDGEYILRIRKEEIHNTEEDILYWLQSKVRNSRAEI